MRTFNAFAASIKLTLSGYHQNSALILRDVMETVFLLSLFAGDPSLVARWRFQPTISTPAEPLRDSGRHDALAVAGGDEVIVRLQFVATSALPGTEVIQPFLDLTNSSSSANRAFRSFTSGLGGFGK